MLPCCLQKDRWCSSLQLLLEKDDEEISASFSRVDFLDLLNRLDLLLSLLVADGCSASRGPLKFG